MMLGVVKKRLGINETAIAHLKEMPFMNVNKEEIVKNICYTELVYQRINKKLKTNYSKAQIEDYIFRILKETEIGFFDRTSKNYYVSNTEKNSRVIVKSNTTD